MNMWAWLLVLGCIQGCFQFEGAIKKDAQRFEKEHPDGFRTTSVAGRSVRWAQVGDPAKQRVLFIHGSPGSWDVWAGFLNDPTLSSQFFLVAPDRLGYGGSCKGCVVASLKVQADALLPALAGAGPAIVVGHSLGGPIAVRLAMDHPDRVAALILVAGSIDPSQEKIAWYQYPGSWVPLRWILPSALDVCNRELMPLKRELEALLPLWSQLKMPVEVIQGMDDNLVPPANADFAERMLTSGNLKVTRVPGMNHFVPWAHPELIRAAILRQAETMHPTVAR